MTTTTRRDFLRKSGIGLAALTLGTALTPRSQAQVVGANGRVRLALIGCYRRFGGVLSAIKEAPNTQVTWVCDVDRQRMEKGAAKVEEVMGQRPQMHHDLRHILEQADVDAVVHMTPDHWHTPGALLSLAAGKHVYIEKPCSHNPYESHLLILAQQKYRLCMQMGNQQRSSAETQEAVQAIHEGAIGDPYEATAFYTNTRGRVPPAVRMPPPDYLDWDLWQGPAPRRPFVDIVGDYNWHWFWTWGTAETGNNAVHELDVARWALKVDRPDWVHSRSAKRHYKDDPWQMYDTMDAVVHFPGDKVIRWDGRSRNGQMTYGTGRGAIIYATEGSAYIDRGGYRLYDRDGKLIRENYNPGNESSTALGGGGSITGRHMANFVAAIRDGAKLNSPIDEGAISTNLGHYMNISSRAGDARIQIDPDTGHFVDADFMSKYWKRDYEPGWEPKV